MGLVMLIVGIGLIVDGIGNYVDQSRQKDWITTSATVTDVSSEEGSSSSLHNSHITYYIMTYEYVVDGKTYTGSTGRMSSPRLVGDTITVNTTRKCRKRTRRFSLPIPVIWWYF